MNDYGPHEFTANGACNDYPYNFNDAAAPSYFNNYPSNFYRDDDNRVNYSDFYAFEEFMSNLP